MREGDKVYYEGNAYIFDGYAKGLAILKNILNKDMIMVESDKIVTVNTYNDFINCLKVGLNTGDISINITNPKKVLYKNDCARKYECDFVVKIKDEIISKTTFQTWNSRLY